MSDYMNRATLIGNLGADPEVRHTQSGQKIVSHEHRHPRALEGPAQRRGA